MLQIRTLSTPSTSGLLSLSQMLMDTPAPRSKLIHPLSFTIPWPSAVHTGNVVSLWEDKGKNLCRPWKQAEGHLGREFGYWSMIWNVVWILGILDLRRGA